jgi:cyclophilin family peptidyl-prolyl cis-trans isomerase
MKISTMSRVLMPLLLSLICFGTSSAQAQTIVTFETNLGQIKIELLGDTRPVSVANFLGYVERGDYDGTLFHRNQSAATQGIGIVQGGGFLTNSLPINRLDPIVNEAATNPNPLNTRGTIAYARTSVLDSATSEFFFNTVDNPGLDSQIFTVFGQVVSGMEVVDQIQALDVVVANGATQTFLDLPVIDVNAPNLTAPSNLVTLISATAVTLGDINLDGEVNFLDISPFINILSTDGSQAEADIDLNGVVNFLDIAPFIEILASQ